MYVCMYVCMYINEGYPCSRLLLVWGSGQAVWQEQVAVSLSLARIFQGGRRGRLLFWGLGLGFRLSGGFAPGSFLG